MLSFARTVNTLALVLLPATSFAHPGHLDGAPLAHELTHGYSYVLISLAAGVLTVQSVSHLLRARASRKRSKI